MKRIRFGLIAGLVFGLLDIIPMFTMEFDDKPAAIIGAFINRLAIGILIPAVQWPISGWVRGLMIGLLLSVPDALITKAYGPILGTGLVGGLIIGGLWSRVEKSGDGAA